MQFNVRMYISSRNTNGPESQVAKAHLRKETRLNSWDIVNFYPNCNTQMCIEAVRKVVEENQHLDQLNAS